VAVIELVAVAKAFPSRHGDVQAGASRLGAPPQVNVIGPLVFVGGLLLVVANMGLLRRRRV
jgi:hypothetical protein